MKLPSHIHGIKRIVRKIKHRPEIMKDFISFREIAMDHGAPESFKSWLQRDMFLHISEGIPFLGYETVQTPCVIFNQDEDSVFVDAGMKALIHGEYRYGDLPTATPRNIFMVYGEYNLSAPSDNDALQMIEDIETISEYAGSKVKLIGLDAQSDFMPDHDVSASAPSKLFFKRLKMIRKATGVAIHIIHHDNRKGEYLGYVGSRNSSDRFVAVSEVKGIAIKSYAGKHGKRRHGTKNVPPLQAEFHFETVDGEPNTELKYVYATLCTHDLVLALGEPSMGRPELFIMDYLKDHGVSMKKPVEKLYGKKIPNSWSKLGKADYIKSSRAPKDRRAKQFELTKDGEAYLEVLLDA